MSVERVDLRPLDRGVGPARAPDSRSAWEPLFTMRKEGLLDFSAETEAARLFSITLVCSVVHAFIIFPLTNRSRVEAEI